MSYRPNRLEVHRNSPYLSTACVHLADVMHVTLPLSQSRVPTDLLVGGLNIETDHVQPHLVASYIERLNALDV